MVRRLSPPRSVTWKSTWISKPGDTVLDIGSNDATSLKAYQTSSLRRIGIDPTGAKFRQYYTDDIALVPDFFTAANYRSVREEACEDRDFDRDVLMIWKTRSHSRAISLQSSLTTAFGISSRATCPRCCG